MMMMMAGGNRGSRSNPELDSSNLSSSDIEGLLATIISIKKWSNIASTFIAEHAKVSATASNLLAEYTGRERGNLEMAERILRGGPAFPNEPGFGNGGGGASAPIHTYINGAPNQGITRGISGILPEGPAPVQLINQPPPPHVPSLAAGRSLSMNLSLFGEIADGGMVMAPSGEAGMDADMPDANPNLTHKVSSQYIGPGASMRKGETTNLSRTLVQFPNTELAIGYTSKSSVQEATSIQGFVHYILAKLWCGEESTVGMSQAYGFPAFDAERNVLGFYREVYDEGPETTSNGENETDEDKAIGLFIPITDSCELGKTQRATIEEKLAAEIAARSQSVHSRSDLGSVKKVVEEGFTYAWTKTMIGFGGNSVFW
jgi:hypothetical protein